jgi:hypothetical protein
MVSCINQKLYLRASSTFLSVVSSWNTRVLYSLCISLNKVSYSIIYYSSNDIVNYILERFGEYIVNI